jgi:hypothetical protein
MFKINGCLFNSAPYIWYQSIGSNARAKNGHHVCVNYSKQIVPNTTAQESKAEDENFSSVRAGQP